MKLKIVAPLLLAMAATLYALIGNSIEPDSLGDPISHEEWTVLLQKHVSEAGNVNYAGFISDSVAFHSYLDLLENNHPHKGWSESERLAYWINAYNAFTVKLIVDNYPTKSIKDLGGSIYKVNTPWDIRFILIEGNDYDLNNIEHDILRKEFDEPRIHFAINCASISCPRLHNEAFTSDQLENQLELVAREFINNPAKNEIKADQVKLSKIFKWFAGDFKQEGLGIIDFVNRYSEVTISEKAKVDYLDYEWGLNE